MATQKQKAAASRILENHGNVSKTMLEVGYSPATAKNPMELTESKGWKELMGEHLSDDVTLRRHEEIIAFGEDKDAIKGIDMHYKLKGYYAADKHINIDIVVEVREELKELAHGLLNSQRQ